MARAIRILIALGALAVLPVFYTASALADEPSPQPTLNFVEAPLDRPPGTTSPVKTDSPAPTTQTPSVSPSSTQATSAPEKPAAQPEVSAPAAPDLAQTGGERDIWITGFSLVSIWVGCAVVTYAHRRGLER